MAETLNDTPWTRLSLSVDADGIALLTLCNEASLNALDTTALSELEDCLSKLMQRTPAPRALIVTGKGKAFVAGASIAEMAGLSPEEALRFAGRGHRVMAMLEELPIPTIAAVNGFALGGGCELALACDIIIASERAKFGQPEVGLGIIPGFGGTQRLVRAVGLQHARMLIFGGEHIRAEQAAAMGLALEVVPSENLLTRCSEIARKFIARAPQALSQAKRTINGSPWSDVASGLALERQAFAFLFGTPDQKEGMNAFLQKRSPVWGKE